MHSPFPSHTLHTELQEIMGKVTIFTVPGCPYCKQAKALLDQKGVSYDEIDISSNVDWIQFMYLLTNGRRSVPQIFFNDKLIGGADELKQLEDAKTLDDLLKQTCEVPSPDFPPPLRRPNGDDFLQIIPPELRQKWQTRVKALNSKLGGTSEKPISSILLMLETPQQMVVICTSGPGKDIYTIGAAGDKGHDGSEEKLYCQVAIENKKTLFIDDPNKFPGLEKNEDYIKYGYAYYVGAPWVVGQTRGTIVAMEKAPGILKREHIAIIEAERDAIEKDLKSWRQENSKN